MQTATLTQKIVSVLLCLALVFSFTPTVALADNDGSEESLAVQNESEKETDNEIESNENEANDNANSWRFENGDQAYSYEGVSTEVVDPYAIAPFAAAPNASSYATWYKSNGITSYTYKAKPSDKGKVVEISGAKRVGIDVSYHNGTINWEKVKNSGVSFAIIRCGYGSDFTSQDDTQFLNNVKGAQENGIDIGIYLYSYAMNLTGNDSSATSEAEHVLRLLNKAGLEPEDLAYPVFYDLEESKQLDLGAKKLGDLATTFCDAISAEGYEVGIYSNLNWWTNYLTDSAFDNSDWHKWAARYPGSNKATDSGVPDTEIWQFSDCGSVDGVSGNVDMNFDYVRSYRYIGWTQESGKWYYLNADGSHKTGWLKISGKWYYLDPEKDGEMRTGVYKVDEKYYASDSSGAMYSSGWAKVSGKWYYANSDGSLKTGWLKTGGKWYYLNSSGAMQTGWEKVDGIWYYLNSSGAMQTGWEKVSGKWYYLNSSGEMQTGWIKLSGKWYYLNSSGAMQTGWEQVGKSWYYMNSSGVMQTGWLKTGGKWYYLNGSGAMQTGWEKIGGKWYYLNSSGAMQTGWEKVSGKWYYLNSSGVMQANKWIGDYYVQSDGSMATNKWIGSYYVGSDGRRIKNYGSSGSSSSSPEVVDVVYWTANGEVYHSTKNCPSLANSKKIFSGSITEAMGEGKSRECRNCF
ncbi:MAG: GH25 family lysozyme [Eggerthellaceae bacterium]|nr:GH25 family lysozyme [Eggerthellaceae bacterium]